MTFTRTKNVNTLLVDAFGNFDEKKGQILQPFFNAIVYLLIEICGKNLFTFSHSEPNYLRLKQNYALVN